MLRSVIAGCLLLVGCGAESPAALDPFADRVVRFTPGPNGGFGQDKLPGVVLGPPQGKGDQAGSLDVVSLAREGTIVVALDDLALVDGPGPDLVVFENPFSTWFETGRVAVSADGVTWYEWPCAADDSVHAWPGCAGVRPVYSAPDNGVSPTDPAKSGGDLFDLADLTLPSVGSAQAPVGPFRYVRIVDSGRNQYAGISGGFDLDAIAALHTVCVDQAR